MTLMAIVTIAIVLLSSCPFKKRSLEALSVFHLIGGKATDSSSWCKSLLICLFLRLYDKKVSFCTRDQSWFLKKYIWKIQSEAFKHKVKYLLPGLSGKLVLLSNHPDNTKSSLVTKFFFSKVAHRTKTTNIFWLQW